MIDGLRVIRRLRTERAIWKRELDTDYIKGIIRGLGIAISIVEELITKKP